MKRDLNLQPAGSGADSGSVEWPSLPVDKDGKLPVAPPRQPESGSGNRNRSVTEAGAFPAPSHKADAPFFLLREVPIWS